MGPPPPPPPPPPLPTAAVLPPRRWKTEDAPRRVNNPVPASSQPTRPTVDASALQPERGLQHAAARLRKTGYNEQIRGDVADLPDGGVGRSDQRLLGRDRPHGEKLDQLEQHQAREPVHASPAGAVHTRPVGNVHRQADSLTIRQSPVTPVQAQPTLTFSTASNSEYYPQPPPPQTFSSRPATHKAPAPEPNCWLASYGPASQDKSDQYARIGDSVKNNNNTVKKNGNSSETILEWSEPYDPNKFATSSVPPILNPQERIRDYATTNYVVDVDERRNASPSTLTRSSPSSRDAARSFISNSLAKQLRDEGLTPSQKYANQFQNSQSPSARGDGSLPFDANRIVVDSFKGDEVDHLVHQMKSNLSSNIDYIPKQTNYPKSALSDASFRSATSSSSTNIRRTNIDQMNINICVSCRREITADQPGCNALNQIFHVDCFKCNRCQKVLAGSSFYNIDDHPTCETCYQESLEKCTSCRKPISDKLLRACGGTFHVACFVCTSCRRPLDGIPFTLDHDNAVHCVPCFHDKFAPRCAVCSKPIVPTEGEKESVRVVAMDKSFHVECYRCEECGMQLSSKVEGQGCYPLDSHLYCKTCNGNRLRLLNSN